MLHTHSLVTHTGPSLARKNAAVVIAQRLWSQGTYVDGGSDSAATGPPSIVQNHNVAIWRFGCRRTLSPWFPDHRYQLTKSALHEGCGEKISLLNDEGNFLELYFDQFPLAVEVKNAGEDY